MKPSAIRIHNDQSPGGLSDVFGILVAWAVIAGLVFEALAAAAQQRAGAAALFIPLILGIAAAIAVFVVVKRRAQSKAFRSWNDQITALAKASPDYGDVDCTSHNAIAIVGDRLFIRTLRGFKLRIAEIPLSLVREFSWEIPGYDRIVTTSMTAAVAFSFANAAAKSEAEQGSGLFVALADIEVPQWQFNSTNEGLLRKWHEILTQVSERRVAQANSARENEQVAMHARSSKDAKNEAAVWTDRRGTAVPLASSYEGGLR